tara:strand:- start:1661 stop:1966 length:306 start_codon:yes stop_codon:yes gene_type:complete
MTVKNQSIPAQPGWYLLSYEPSEDRVYREAIVAWIVDYYVDSEGGAERALAMAFPVGTSLCLCPPYILSPDGTVEEPDARFWDSEQDWFDYMRRKDKEASS